MERRQSPADIGAKNKATQLMSNAEKKIIYICKRCGSDQITFDATAYWDVEKQDFVLTSTQDASWCGGCDGEASVDEVEVEEKDFAEITA